jgi:hypothetical protein
VAHKLDRNSRLSYSSTMSLNLLFLPKAQPRSSCHSFRLCLQTGGTGFGTTLLALSVLLSSPVARSEEPVTNSPPTRLPTTEVVGQFRSIHDVTSETELVGPANQPEWTTRRIFAETDVYVIPTGEIEFNQFYISSHPRHDKPANLFESELEIGLPWRTQFDVEMNYSVVQGNLQYDSTMLELPHALADWGKIPLNPTVDAGWRFNVGEADSYLFRLLLAEQFSDRLQFGANLAYERQTGGERETDYELTAALNYSLIDSKLSVGAQLIVEYETAQEREFDAEDNVFETKSTYSTSVLLGPSLLYRPTQTMYLGVTPLFGLTHDAPVVEAYFLLGIDFEPFGNRYAKANESPDTRQFDSLRRRR